MPSMAHSQPENHVAITADRATELDSVSIHIGDSLVARFFNVRNGLRANSHPPSAALPWKIFHRSEHSLTPICEKIDFP